MGPGTRLAVALSAVLLCQAALAQGKAKAPASPLAAATRAMGEGEFDLALRTLDQAIATTKEPAELAKLHLVRGQCLLAQGRTDAARQAFTAALTKDPAVVLDAKKASPDAVTLFDKARAELPGTVSITVSNGDADVQVDERALGPAPLTTQLSAGKHRVVVRASDGRVAEREANVAAGRRLDVRLELPAPVVLKTTPVAELPPPPPPPAVTTTAAPKRTAAWVILGSGVAVGAAGGVMLGLGAGEYNRLKTARHLSTTEANAAVTNGKLYQGLGLVGVGVGAAAIATGVVLMVLPGDSPQVSAVITPDGSAWVGVSGVLP